MDKVCLRSPTNNELGRLHKLIAGSKEFSRQVSFEEGQAFADRMGTLFVECSAKTNVGVVDIFQDLVRQVCYSFRHEGLQIEARICADVEKILQKPELWSRSPQKDKAIQISEDENDREGWCGC